MLTLLRLLDFSVNSSNQSGRSRNRFPDAMMLVSSIRVVAGLDKKSSDVSCGNDVEDVLALELEEPVDNPGTTICAIFGYLWILTTGRVLRRVCLTTGLVPTVVGILDTRLVSSSAEFRSFLSVCIDAPQSTTNSLSSSFLEDGAGNDRTSEGEKNVVLSLSL